MCQKRIIGLHLLEILDQESDQVVDAFRVLAFLSVQSFNFVDVISVRFVDSICGLPCAEWIEVPVVGS